jgi:hypothetical protein
MMCDHAEKTLADATQRRSPTALAVQLIGRLVEALLKTVPEVACEALDQRILRAKEGVAGEFVFTLQPGVGRGRRNALSK